MFNHGAEYKTYIQTQKQKKIVIPNKTTEKTSKMVSQPITSS